MHLFNQEGKMEVVVQHKQTLLDIAIQYCGDAQALVELADLNEISLTEEVEAGILLILPAVRSPQLVSYFSNGNYLLATKPTSDLLNGISYWAVGYDFTIS